MEYLITESQYNKMIDNFISSRFDGFEEKTTPDYPKSIFWIKDGKIIAEIEYLEDLYVDPDIWDIITLMFSFEYKDTKSSIKHWLENHYNSLKLDPLRVTNNMVNSTWNEITKWNN